MGYYGRRIVVVNPLDHIFSRSRLAAPLFVLFYQSIKCRFIEIEKIPPHVVTFFNTLTVFV